jgi:DtxR family Mn-dependent transcriptional regulator
MAAFSLAERSPSCCSIEHSEAVEDYLKVLYLMAGEGELATTSRVAVRLGVSAPSVSAMVQRLVSAGLIEHTGKRQVRLTPHGLQHARGVVRRHRLLETFLVKVLGVPWDEVHAEAEVLEHAVSARIEERIAARLGHPNHDPHGDPIPPKHGSCSEEWPEALFTAPSGVRFRVERVSDRDSEPLRYLGELGIRPGVVLVVEERAPFGGPLWISVDGQRHALGEQLARLVHGTVEAVHEAVVDEDANRAVDEDVSGVER